MPFSCAHDQYRHTSIYVLLYVLRVHHFLWGSRIQNPENRPSHVEMSTTAALNDCSCKRGAEPTSCHLT